MKPNQAAIKLSQEWYDANRQDFGAESTSQDIDKLLEKKCDHYMIRKTGTSVECNKCHWGLFDMGKFKLKDGKVLAT